MLDLYLTGRYKKDLKNIVRRGYNLDLLSEAVDILRIPEKLPRKYRPHSLIGDYSGFNECHITPDWLLIYRYHEEFLELARTGTHSDLFRG